MFELPKRQFEFKDFEPVVDSKTMEIHYGKHHQAYINNLNQIIDNNQLPIFQSPIEVILQKASELPAEIRQGVINNGGGHYNHCLWWEQLRKPAEGNEPTGKLRAEIDKTFGSFEAFREQFSKAAMTRFGSGWAWLSLADNSKLVVHSSANQDSPIMEGKKPLLALDVWEHAYYLNYQNRRVDYVNAFWQIVDWEVVAGRLK